MDSFAYKDMIYTLYYNFIDGTNVEIVDVGTTDYNFQLLCFDASDVYLDNITIISKALGNENRDIDYVKDCQVIVQNLHVENYYLADMNHIRNCDYSTIYIINTNVNNNVCGEAFWYFIDRNDLTIPMNAIYDWI